MHVSHFLVRPTICCCCLVTKLYPTLWETMDCSPPGSSVRGISKARILEWVAISFSRGSSSPRDWTCISCLGRRILDHWSTREAPLKDKGVQKENPHPHWQLVSQKMQFLFNILPHQDLVPFLLPDAYACLSCLFCSFWISSELSQNISFQ